MLCEEGVEAVELWRGDFGLNTSLTSIYLSLPMRKMKSLSASNFSKPNIQLDLWGYGSMLETRLSIPLRKRDEWQD